VTLLVTGDVMIDQNATLSINGEPGDHGSIGGTGGQGGPGGFRGGDGANPTVNGANDGGAGFGPGGGEPGTAASVQSGHPGRYVNVGELLPLLGGSGGGGGASTGVRTNCAGGGGGGGGGALLIAANGTITINGTLTANGGRGGSRSGVAACASGGGGGSGGAIRLLADTITGTGNRPVVALGGTNTEGTVPASDGAVRLEAFTNTLPASITDTPQAVRVSAPGRLVHPLMPTIAITAVNGQPISPRTRGPFGRVDVSMLSPGPLIIALHTSGVPRGTIVQVSVKSQVGGTLIPGTATLTLCDSAGDCDVTVEVNVPALPDTRAYFIEAQATFQTP
jgi:hypothetical protein